MSNQFFKERDQIEEWLNHYRIEDYHINDDLTVDVDKSVTLGLQNEEESAGYTQLRFLPVQFGRVQGDFITLQRHFIDLYSMKGCPHWVGGVFNLGFNHISSIEFIPEYVGSGIYLHAQHNQLKSLHMIHRHLKRMGDEGKFDIAYSDVTSDRQHGYDLPDSMLGLILIKNLDTVETEDGKFDDIMNYHLKHDRDIHACQEDLIEAGFGAQARI